ncbi:hypothetical protein ANN_25330 [Periplaneta americana]|uniref:Transposase Tc1-like domain-containing protein n=1 Tax=Periplaneta americana TaxID=6978 RepID=A0ABQ8S175_PERAM|nr:hypothetical protein ANN_25330 [Periplaneta americana]
MDTTPRKRSKIITLAEHSSMTQRQIAAECHIGLATVNSIIKRYRETESITPQKKKGNCSRKRKTSPADDRLIIRKSKLNPRLTAVDLTRELMATTGANIHVTTVRRRLLEAGRRARKPIKKQLLTPVMCKRRLMWAKLHQHWAVNDWKNVLFSDESHFEVHGHRVSYVRKGSEKVTAAHLQQAPKYPLKIVPQLQKPFPDGRGVFQQDLAPCHTSRKTTEFFNKKNIQVMEAFTICVYGHEVTSTSTPHVGDEQRLRVFENKVLRKLFGARRDEVTGEWRKLHNTELQALHSSPDIIRNIKSRRLRWAGHVARIGESRNAYRVLVGRPEGKRPLGRPRRRWEDNIKIDLREVGYDDREWIDLAQDRDQWRAYVRAAVNLRSAVKNLKVRIYKTVILPVLLYGCETWTLSLREEHRLRVFENKVLRKIFGAKRDEVTGEWRKLHNTELHALYSSPNIIRNIKSRRLRWAGHIARMGESRNAYRMLVGRPESKRPLGRPRRRWEDNIKMDLREVGYDDRDWINLAQDRDRWRAYVRAAMNLRQQQQQQQQQGIPNKLDPLAAKHAASWLMQRARYYREDKDLRKLKTIEHWSAMFRLVKTKGRDSDVVGNDCDEVSIIVN